MYCKKCGHLACRCPWKWQDYLMTFCALAFLATLYYLFGY